MMRLICLDSTFLISVLRGKDQDIKLLDRYKDEGFSFYTTTINLYEIFYSYFLVFKDEEQKRKEFELIKRLFSVLRVIPLTMNSAIRASLLKIRLQTQGLDIGLNDTYIAAIALENGNRILTHNVDHFKPIKDLKVN